MPKELYLETLNFFVRAIEAKEMELGSTTNRFRLARLETELDQLKGRFQLELSYLQSVTGLPGE